MSEASSAHRGVLSHEGGVLSHEGRVLLVEFDASVEEVFAESR